MLVVPCDKMVAIQMASSSASSDTYIHMKQVRESGLPNGSPPGHRVGRDECAVRTGRGYREAKGPEVRNTMEYSSSFVVKFQDIFHSGKPRMSSY